MTSVSGTRTTTLAAIALLVVFVSSRASAEEASPPATTATVPNEPTPPAYRSTIDAAVAEFAAGHHAEARALFRRAHEMRPNARTLRGIGMCAFELREYAEAVRMLSASLTDTRRPLTEEQIVQVRDAIERANVFVGRFEIAVPEGASVHVDDAATAAELDADGTLLLSLGAHLVALRREGAVLGESRVDVRGGERERLVITQTVTPAPTPLPTPTPVPSPVTTQSRGEPDLVPGIALVASGAALLVGGAIVFGVGLADAATVEGASAGTTWSSLAGAYDRAPILQGVGAASLGVGVALAAVGGILLGLEGTSSDHVERAAVRFEIGVGGASLGGVF